MPKQAKTKKRAFYPKYNKYHNTKVVVDGITFDSTKEARRYQELKILEQNGEITNLQRQVPFELIPAQYEPNTIGPRGGIKKGKCLARSCVYRADFTYEKDGQLIVEDTKGMRLSDYQIKKKLMLYMLHIRITEI